MNLTSRWLLQFSDNNRPRRRKRTQFHQIDYYVPSISFLRGEVGLATETQTAFFSYSRDDSEFAVHLAEDLKAAGENVWLDQLDIEPGTPWDREVQKALANCPRMLVILSPTSVSSDNVLDEVSFALSKQKKVIPVLYRECDIPFRLARLQFIDFRTDYARGLKALLRTLGVEQPPGPSIPASSITPKESQTDVSDVDKRRGEAQYARLEQGRRPGSESSRLPFSQLPAWMKIAAAVCGVLIVVSVLYWALSRSRLSEEIGKAQKQQAQSETSNSPASGEPAQSEHPGGPPPNLETQKPSTSAESQSTQGQGGPQSRASNIEAAKANPPITGSSGTAAKDTLATIRSLHSSGWAVGTDGTILHTEDGGRSWEPQSSGTSVHLSSVAFATPQSGWAVGEKGTILHTEDAGATWKPQSSGTREHLSSVAFATSQSGWAVGPGIILHTEDGGGTWKTQSGGSNASLRSVSFVTPQSGWAVGDGGIILHTKDGGGAWTGPPDMVLTSSLSSVTFATRQSGWAVGLMGTIRHTEDGGGTWKTQTDGSDASLRSVSFVTPQSGWAVGDGGTILYTRDGGGTWKEQQSGTTAQLYSVSFATPQSAWVVGEKGIILRTDDGGGTWKVQISNTRVDLMSVTFVIPR